MDDDFQPALETAAPAGEASDTTHHTRIDAPDAPPPPVRRGDDPTMPPPDATTEMRSQRVRSTANRAMFRELAEKIKAGEVSIEADDLVPVEHAAPVPVAAKPAPVVAPVAPGLPAAASPAAQAAAALPVAPPPGPVPRAPVAPPPGLPAIPQADTRAIELERREAQIKEREAQLEARAKKLPTRERMLEAPILTLEEWLKDTYGITDDVELGDTVTDLMTMWSERRHSVKLPPEVKASVDGRQALRSVKAIRATLDSEKASLAERETAAKKAADDERAKSEVTEYERRAVGQLTSLLQPAEATYPYLAVQDGAPAIVWEVLKAAHEQGNKIQWSEAAQWANDHFKEAHEKSQAEAAQRAARLQTLLAPVAPTAPAKPAPSPGGAPGPAPTQPAVAAQQPTPPPRPATDPADEIIGEDRRERRSRSLRGLVAKHGLVPQ